MFISQINLVYTLIISTFVSDKDKEQLKYYNYEVLSYAEYKQ